MMETMLNVEPLNMEEAGIAKGALDGKVAVVTGGASNVGLGYARCLAWAGAKVVVADLNETAGAATQALINEENGADVCLFVKTNVTELADIQNLAEQAFAKFGKVDILINNAMNMRLNGPVLSSKIEDLDMSYAISARGVMMLIQAFVPGMLERGYGVVTYSATQFHYCPPMVGGTIYTAGKAAATSLIMSLANEVRGKGVYVFCLTPAGVGRIDPARLEKIKKERPDFDPKQFAMSGFPGMIPPEAGGAAMVYSILHAQELHGSGVIMQDALYAMHYPFPVPESVIPPEGHRLTDLELTMAFCTMGPGYENLR